MNNNSCVSLELFPVVGLSPQQGPTETDFTSSFPLMFHCFSSDTLLGHLLNLSIVVTAYSGHLSTAATCLQQPCATCLQQPLVYCHNTGPMPYTSTTEPSMGKVISKFNHPQVG